MTPEEIAASEWFDKHPIVSRGTFSVFFYDRKERNWWDAVTEPGFRHCSVALDNGHELFTLDFTEGCLIPARFDLSMNTLVKSQEDFGDFNRCVVISAELLDKAHDTRFTIVPAGPFMSCVSIAKAFMCVYWPLAVTPKQLYKRMVAAGGTIHYGRSIRGKTQAGRGDQGGTTRPAKALEGQGS